MKTILPLVFCFFFSTVADCQTFPEVNQTFKKAHIYSDTLITENTNARKAGAGTGSKQEVLACKGNGLVTFVNSSLQPLFFYYWYVEDVPHPNDECRFRRLWKQLDTGNNTFIIPENKTLIFRICINQLCLNTSVKQFGIVHFCSVNNGIIQIR